MNINQTVCFSGTLTSPRKFTQKDQAHLRDVIQRFSETEAIPVSLEITPSPRKEDYEAGTGQLKRITEQHGDVVTVIVGEPGIVGRADDLFIQACKNASTDELDPITSFEKAGAASEKATGTW